MKISTSPTRQRFPLSPKKIYQDKECVYKFLYLKKGVEWDSIKYMELNKYVLPNKEERLLVPPLLRTVHETFASYGSSILSPFGRAAVICHGDSIKLYVVQNFKCLIC